MNEIAAQETFDVKIPTPELSKGEREQQAFRMMLPALLGTHRGKYVAVHNGQVVDSDLDDVALILRVHAKIGYVPLYVGLVTDSLPIVARIPHYHEARSQGNS